MVLLLCLCKSAVPLRLLFSLPSLFLKSVGFLGGGGVTFSKMESIEKLWVSSHLITPATRLLCVTRGNSISLAVGGCEKKQGLWRWRLSPSPDLAPFPLNSGSVPLPRQTNQNFNLLKPTEAASRPLPRPKGDTRGQVSDAPNFELGFSNISPNNTQLNHYLLAIKSGPGRKFLIYKRHRGLCKDIFAQVFCLLLVLTACLQVGSGPCERRREFLALPVFSAVETLFY